jgi:hypothetical protein
VAKSATSELSQDFFFLSLFFFFQFFVISSKFSEIITSYALSKKSHRGQFGGSTDGTEVFPDGMGRSGPNGVRFAVEKNKKESFSINGNPI